MRTGKTIILLIASSLLLSACGGKDPYTYRGPVHTNPADTGATPPGPVDTTDVPQPPAPPTPVEVTLLDPFTEEFDALSTDNLVFSRDPLKPDYRYFSGFPSLSESGKTVLMLRLNPADPSGVGALASAQGFFEEGSVSARVRIPDISSVQPKLAAAFELVLCAPDGTDAVKLSLPLAQSSKVTVSIGENEQTLTPSLPGFKSSSKFYIYGIDLGAGSVSVWVKASASAEKTVLAEFTEGLPSGPLRPVIRFFHTSPAALYPYEAEVDWVTYQKD